MTEGFNSGHYMPDYSTFSGEIDIDDFNTNCPNKKRISNYIDADNLRNAITEKINQKKEEKKYMNMTLEELRAVRLISNTNGRPSSSLTDEKWQKEIRLRKYFITPYDKSVHKLKGKYSRESGMWNEETMGTYHGETSWQSYVRYINDVLDNIRAGQIDYCYFYFQVDQLLHFHYNTLRTKYCDGYWEVWLER